MLGWRTATAVVLAPVVLAAIALGETTILALLLLVVSLAAYEFSRVVERLPFLAALGAGLLPVLLSVPYGVTGVLAGAVFGLPWALVWLAANPESRTIRALLAVLLMAIWVGAPLAHVALISRLEDGTALVLITVVGPWISDTAAYFSGRFFGRHKIFPILSPKKTFEGGLGGLLVTILLVGVASQYFLGFAAWKATLAGAAISLFSQAGDLFESTLKRMLETKDLGRALPGHGGILDRIDSLLFTAPAVYYILLFL